MKYIGRTMNILTAILMVLWSICELSHYMDGTANKCTVFLAAMPLIFAVLWSRMTFTHWNEDSDETL